MMNLSIRAKSALLVLTMMTTGHTAHAFSLAGMRNALPSAKMVGITGFVIGYIWLQAKGTDYNYKLSDLPDDLKKILEVNGITDKKLYRRILKFINKYVVGKKLSIYDKTIRTKNDDGAIISKKDKYVKSTPFGLIGLIDAYVILPLEGLGKIATNWDSASKLFAKFDNSVTVNVTVNK